jgi:PIN domain nuclease of toxin-antitoxin system
MDIVADASAFLAVVLNEATRDSVIQCSIENRLPVLSLDTRMCEVAKRLQVQLVE